MLHSRKGSAMAALVDLLLQRAISKSFRSLTEQEAQYPSPATSSEQPSCSEQRALDARCRLCLGGPDELDCGSLVSPCACKGSCAHIHSGEGRAAPAKSVVGVSTADVRPARSTMRTYT